MCFVFIWEQTATCATYSMNWLVFTTDMKSVYSTVRTGSINKAVCASSLKGWFNYEIQIMKWVGHVASSNSILNEEGDSIFLWNVIKSVYKFSRYSGLLRPGQSGDRLPVEATFSALVQTGPGAHPSSYTMGTGSFPGVKRPGRGVVIHPFLAPRLKKIRAIPLLPLWVFVPCSGVNFTFTFTLQCTPTHKTYTWMQNAMNTPYIFYEYLLFSDKDWGSKSLRNVR